MKLSNIALFVFAVIVLTGGYHYLADDTGARLAQCQISAIDRCASLLPDSNKGNHYPQNLNKECFSDVVLLCMRSNRFLHDYDDNALCKLETINSLLDDGCYKKYSYFHRWLDRSGYVRVSYLNSIKIQDDVGSE